MSMRLNFILWKWRDHLGYNTVKNIQEYITHTHTHTLSHSAWHIINKEHVLFFLLFLSPYFCSVMPWYHCVFTTSYKTQNSNVFQQKHTQKNSLMISHMLYSRLFLHAWPWRNPGVCKCDCLPPRLVTEKYLGTKRKIFFSVLQSEAPLLTCSFKTRHIPCQYLCYSRIFPIQLHLLWKSTGPPRYLCRGPRKDISHVDIQHYPPRYPLRCCADAKGAGSCGTSTVCHRQVDRRQRSHHLCKLSNNSQPTLELM